MNKHTDNDKREILHSKIISFFREELDSRYRIENLQKIPAIAKEGLLEGVTQEMIDRVKVFFREVLYPVGEDRYKRDRSVEKVMALLKNKLRLVSLLPALPGIVFRHGSALVTATQAGSEVLSAYRFSIKIEQEAAENLEEMCEEHGVEIETAAPIPSDLFRKAFSQVPRDWPEKMMDQLRELTTLSMHRGTIDATIEVMNLLKKALDSEKEKQAIEYALWVLYRLEAEVQHHSSATLKRLLRISELAEVEYIENLYSSASE